MAIFETGLVTMINTRGRLCYVSNSEVPLRKQQGCLEHNGEHKWQIIINPKRNYYPEYDCSNPHNKIVISKGDINEDEESKNYLIFENV